MRKHKTIQYFDENNQVLKEEKTELTVQEFLDKFTNTKAESNGVQLVMNKDLGKEIQCRVLCRLYR